MKCPKCKFEWKDERMAAGGRKSKRKDMGKGSEGQEKAQAGRKKTKKAEGKSR
jgi:hypothetical protein